VFLIEFLVLLAGTVHPCWDRCVNHQSKLWLTSQLLLPFWAQQITSSAYHTLSSFCAPAVSLLCGWSYNHDYPWTEKVAQSYSTWIMFVHETPPNVWAASLQRLLKTSMAALLHLDAQLNVKCLYATLCCMSLQFLTYLPSSETQANIHIQTKKIILQ
jgi:hypothetical protein